MGVGGMAQALEESRPSAGEQDLTFRGAPL